MAGKQKEWNSAMETVILNKFSFASNCHAQKHPYSLNTHSLTSIGRFSWQLEYGYGLLQVYFKKNC